MQWLLKILAFLRGNPKMSVAALTLSTAGAGALLQHEGSVPRVYLDPTGIRTVCVGHTVTVQRIPVGTEFSAQQCQGLLQQDTKHAEAGVKAAVRVPVTQQQYDQLVSLAFNIGNTAFARSTLVRKLNSEDCSGAAAEFDRWVYAKGRKLPGLVKRRADERRLFEEDC